MEIYVATTSTLIDTTSQQVTTQNAKTLPRTPQLVAASSNTLCKILPLWTYFYDSPTEAVFVKYAIQWRSIHQVNVWALLLQVIEQSLLLLTFAF